MINILPPGERQNLFIEKKERLAAIWGMVVLIFLICLALILLSIKYYLLVDADYQRSLLGEAQQKTQTPEFVELNNTIQKYNATLAQIGSFYNKETQLNQAIETIKNIKYPKGLYLTSFSLIRASSGAIQVKVFGFSDTRESLLDFKKNTEQEPKIKNPYFPPENWVKSKDINFYLTFEIALNNEEI